MGKYKLPLTPEQRKEIAQKIMDKLNKDPKYKAHIEYINNIPLDNKQ